MVHVSLDPEEHLTGTKSMQQVHGPENDEFVPVTTCYQVWGRTTPCIHCSTLRTCRQNITTDKYEVKDNEVFHVTSKPIDIDGHMYALEIVTRLRLKSVKLKKK